jgi:hypothetical protein
MATLADRNNNPGNLRDTSTGSFRQFKTPQEGYAALLNDLQAKKTGTTTTGVGPSSTLADFAKVYAPPSENDSAQYTANLANFMGARPDSRLSELDVGKWADAIARAEGYSGAGQPAQTPKPAQAPVQTPAPAPQAAPVAQPAPKKDFLQTATDVVTSIFPGKQVGEAIGTLGGYLAAPKKNKEFYDTSAPSPLQVAGDVAQGALTIGAGMPAKALSIFGKTVPMVKPAAGILGRVGQTAGLGAGIAGTGAIAKGETDPMNIAKTTGVGGLVGGALGSAGEIVRAATKNLPESFIRSYIPGINKETAQYAASKKIGTPDKMLVRTEAEIEKVGSQLGNALKSPQYEGLKIPGRDLYQRVVQQFPEAGLDENNFYDQLKKLVPLKKTLIEKLRREGLDLKELHSLNSALGRSTFKTVFDDPVVKAGKEIGSSFYHAAGDAIKSVAPETEPMFSILSKEYPLRTALEKAIRRGEKAKAITLKDIVFITGGFTGAGPMGALGGYAASRALTSPSVNLGAANLIRAGNTGALKPLIPLALRPSANIPTGADQR